MGLNLGSMSRQELLQLKTDIDKAIESYDERKRLDALQAADKAAREHGYSLDDLVKHLSGGKAKKVSPPKYINPENVTETWSGRGRKPKWFQAAIESGKAPEQLEAN